MVGWVKTEKLKALKDRLKDQPCFFVREREKKGGGGKLRGMISDVRISYLFFFVCRKKHILTKCRKRNKMFKGFGRQLDLPRSAKDETWKAYQTVLLPCWILLGGNKVFILICQQRQLFLKKNGICPCNSQKKSSKFWMAVLRPKTHWKWSSKILSERKNSYAALIRVVRNPPPKAKGVNYRYYGIPGVLLLHRY